MKFIVDRNRPGCGENESAGHRAQPPEIPLSLKRAQNSPPPELFSRHHAFQSLHPFLLFDSISTHFHSLLIQRGVPVPSLPTLPRLLARSSTRPLYTNFNLQRSYLDRLHASPVFTATFLLYYPRESTARMGLLHVKSLLQVRKLLSNLHTLPVPNLTAANNAPNFTPDGQP